MRSSSYLFKKATVLLIFAAVWLEAGFAVPDIGAPGYTCPDMKKSKVKPTSAHSVRPADIDIVAAMGDSLTAGNGARSVEPLTLFLEYRGVSFPIGGDESLDTHITIPNILRKYNPDLFGQSHGIGKVDVWEVAYLNGAVPSTLASDMPGQARDIISKMKAHPEVVDFENDWKLVHLFIGGNDMCIYCTHRDQESAKNFSKGIKEAIQILHDNLPRTIVSLTGMFHLEMLQDVDTGSVFCLGLHIFECECEWHSEFTPDMMYNETKLYQQVEMDLQTSGIFDTKDDFTLIIQPYLRDVLVPPMLNGSTDMSFFAPDCFHFTQKGHAIVASWLWNNMLQPVDQKNVKANLSYTEPLACPDPECPFIRTTKNSEDCSKYMTPAVADLDNGKKKRV